MVLEDRERELLRYTPAGSRGEFVEHLRRRWIWRLALICIAACILVIGGRHVLRNVALVLIDTGGEPCWAIIEGERYDLEKRSWFVLLRWRELGSGPDLHVTARSGFIPDPGSSIQDDPVIITVTPKNRLMECYDFVYKCGFHTVRLVTKWRKPP